MLGNQIYAFNILDAKHLGAKLKYQLNNEKWIKKEYIRLKKKEWKAKQETPHYLWSMEEFVLWNI